MKFGSRGSDLDALADGLRRAAADVGAMVLPGYPRGKGEVLPVMIPAALMPDLISHLRPRLVYLEVEQFDAAEDTLHELMESEDDGDAALLERPRVKAFVKSHRQYDGQTSRLVGGVVCDGIVHCMIEDAPWFEKFRGEAQSLEEEADFHQELRDRACDKKEQARLKAMVDRLIADPRFSAPKNSKSKREYLAKTLFPNLSSREVFDLVTEAESAVWLASAG